MLQTIASLLAFIYVALWAWAISQEKERPTYNLKPIKIKNQDEDEDEDEKTDRTVDLIFVHGLGSHPQKSWIDEVDWIQEQLGPCLQKNNIPARLWFPGYDSALGFDAPVTDLNTLANNLAATIESLILRRDGVQRIVFLAHSYGGLVVKRALVMNARKSNPTFASITSAVLFFGTPHTGSGLAASVGTLLSSLRPLGCDVSLLAGLIVNSRESRTLYDDFLQLLTQRAQDTTLGRLGVVNFFELRKTPILRINGWTLIKGMVVTQESATFNFANSKNISLNRNHKQINKFGGDGYSIDYGNVERCILEAVQQSLGMAEIDRSPRGFEVPNFVNALSFQDMEEDFDEPGRAELKETCDWLFETNEYYHWFNIKHELHGKLLCIEGNMGTGKSTLMRHTFSSLSKSTDRNRVAAFFFKSSSSDPLCCSFLGFLRSALHQLVRSDIVACQKLKRFLEQKSDQRKNDLWDLKPKCNPDASATHKERFPRKWNPLQTSDIQNFFLGAYLDLLESRWKKDSTWRSFLLVDALDEADDTEQEDVINFLLSMGEKCREREIPFLICVSSRPYLAHRPARLDNSLPGILSLNIRDYRQLHTESMRKYAEANLVSMRGMEKKRMELLEEIEEKWNQMFLWVCLTVTDVNKGYQEGRVPKIRPADYGQIEDLLDELLKDIKEKDRTIWMFRWVLFARRQLSPRELCYAVEAGICDAHDDNDTAEKPKSWDKSELDDMDDTLVQNYIKSNSKGLIETGRRARLIHDSLAVHLRRSLFPHRDELSHLALANTCIWYLVRGLSNFDPESGFPVTDNLEYDSSEQHSIVSSESAAGNHLSYEDPEDSSTGDSGSLGSDEHSRSIESDEYSRSEGSDEYSKILAKSIRSDESFARPDWDSTWEERDLMKRENPLISYVVEFLFAHAEKAYSSTIGDQSSDALKLLRHEPRFIKTYAQAYDVLRTGNSCPLRSDVALSYVLADLGHLKLLELLEARGELHVNEQGGMHGNPLNAAVAHQHKETVEFLINHQADVNGTGGTWGGILHAACAKSDAGIVKSLLDAGADPDMSIGPLNTPLQTAAQYGRLENATMILRHGVQVNRQGGIAGNALQTACSAGHPELVDMLLDKGASISETGGIFNCVFQAAAFSGNLDVFKRLLRDGANVNLHGSLDARSEIAKIIKNSPQQDPASSGKSPKSAGSLCLNQALHAAATGGHLSVVRLLLTRNADVNSIGGLYGSALQGAAISGSGRVVKELLLSGADVDIVGGLYCTALQAAALQEFDNIEDDLLKRRPNLNTCGGLYGHPLQAALLGAGLWGVTKLFVKVYAQQLKFDLSSFHSIYLDGLQAAAASNTCGLEIVELLLAHGADVNAVGGMYGTALQAATADFSKVRLLVDRGADVNARGGIYGAALQAASAQGNTATVKFLLRKGADVNAEGGIFGSALQAAIICGTQKKCQVLMSAGADVHKTGGVYGSMLRAASARGDESIIGDLWGSGAGLKKFPDEIYANILIAAASKGRLEMLRFLLDRDPPAAGVDGLALLLASCSGDVDEAKRLWN